MGEYYALIPKSESLEHYGVKGMKWGVRKQTKSLSSRYKRYATKKVNQYYDKKEAKLKERRARSDYQTKHPVLIKNKKYNNWVAKQNKKRYDEEAEQLKSDRQWKLNKINNPTYAYDSAIERAKVRKNLAKAVKDLVGKKHKKISSVANKIEKHYAKDEKALKKSKDIFLKSKKGTPELKSANKRQNAINNTKSPTHDQLLKSTNAKQLYKNRNLLSDKELDNRINRMEKEQHLKELSNKQQSAGKKWAKKVLVGAATTVATITVTNALKKVVNKTIKNND